MGVKTKYRPDWLDNENTIFINKLNHTTKNFQNVQNLVSKIIFNKIYRPNN